MKEKICVFGCGRYYRLKEKSLKDKYTIEAFIDNLVLQGFVDQRDGIPMYNPIDYISKDVETKILMMSSEWWDMWNQLKSLGVSDERILFGTELEPFYDNVEGLFFNKVISIKSHDNKIIFIRDGKEYEITSKEEHQRFVRELFALEDVNINAIKKLPVNPVSRRFGTEFGTVIDRLYIEDFFQKHKEEIKGTTMEIGDSRYMTMFGDKIEENVVLHVNGWGGKKGNLATGEGIDENSVDCLICTQTLQHIYDIKTSVENIYKLLKPGGTALVTNGCIAQLSLYDYHNWGEYWKCTDLTMKNMFSEVFGKDKVQVETYGNMKAAIAFLYGMCAEDIPKDELFIRDEQFPMLVAVVAKK